MCFNITKCKRMHPGEKNEISCGKVRICLWKQWWIQGMKSGWTAECSAQKCNYIFSICIYVSMLYTAYLCPDVSLSTVGITKNLHKRHRPVKPLQPQTMLQMVKQRCVGVNYFHTNVIQSQWPIFTQLAELENVCTKVKVWHFEMEWLSLLPSSENYNK